MLGGAVADSSEGSAGSAGSAGSVDPDYQLVVRVRACLIDPTTSVEKDRSKLALQMVLVFKPSSRTCSAAGDREEVALLPEDYEEYLDWLEGRRALGRAQRRFEATTGLERLPWLIS